MTMTRAIPTDVHGRVRRPISIQRLLEWAFADECASIDFEDPGTLARGYRNFGTEWVMMQRQLLGCPIDGGGRSEPDHDADLVASACAVLPEGVGGRRMAMQIAELARARLSPDVSPGVATVCQPRRWRGNRYGRQAETLVIGRAAEVVDGLVRSVEVRCCPVEYDLDVRYAGVVQRNYLLWWSALLELRTTFQYQDDLSRWQVTDEMPARQPWKKSFDG